MSKPRLLKSFLIGVSSLLLTATVAAANRQVYHDYARVLNVSPIMETIQVPVRREDCQPPPPIRHQRETHAPIVSDVQPDHTGHTLADAIRLERSHQLSLATAHTERHCRWIEEFETRERIVAYRVRFRYGRDIFVRRLNHDPGDRLQIRVEVQPLD